MKYFKVNMQSLNTLTLQKSKGFSNWFGLAVHPNEYLGTYNGKPCKWNGKGEISKGLKILTADRHKIIREVTVTDASVLID